MAKSKRDLSYRLVGELDLAGQTITEYDKDGEIVAEHDLTAIIEQFDGKEVTFAIKESSELM